MKPLPFFKGLSWLIFLNIVIKPVWIFVIDRQVQNIVGFEAYGTYFALLNLSIVLSFVSDAGLTNMVNRQIALHGAEAAVPFKPLLVIKALLLLLYVGVVLFIAWMTELTHWHILFQVIIIQVLTSIFLFCRNIITAHQLFTVDAWLSVIDKLLMIFICGAFIYIPLTFGTIDLNVFLNSQIVCTSIAIGVAVFILLYKKLLINDVKQRFHTGIFVATLPFAFIILLMSAHYRLDGFLLERLHDNGAFEAGIYASAYRLLDAGNMIGFLAASFLVPFIARNQNNHLLLQKTILFLRHALLLCGIGAVAFVVVFAGALQQWLYHTTAAYNILILQLCLAALPAYYLGHIYGSLLTAKGQFNTFIAILFFCVVINVVINVFFIPVYGALACCVAALISQYSCGILVYIMGSKKNNMALSLGSFAAYILVALISIFVFFWIRVYLF